MLVYKVEDDQIVMIVAIGDRGDIYKDIKKIGVNLRNDT